MSPAGRRQGAGETEAARVGARGQSEGERDGERQDTATDERGREGLQPAAEDGVDIRERPTASRERGTRVFSFHSRLLTEGRCFYLSKNIYVVPAHQTSDMSRCTISPESRLKLEMVILSNLHFLTILTFQYVNYQFMCPDFNKH